MNKEKALKVKLVSTVKNLYDDEMINCHECKGTFVSDGIGEAFKTWTFMTPVLISAQTGKGKNTFIENSLLKFASETKSKTLIISNRISCNRQQKVRIANLMGCENVIDELTPKGLDKLELFNNVRVITYQKLGSYFDNIFQRCELENYSIVIFDECHFFISDALFNNQTGLILNKSLLTFKNSLRIYMSATPEEIFPIIIEKEKALVNTQASSFPYINYGTQAIIKPKEIMLYDFKRDYTYVVPKYFDNLDEIIDTIKADGSSSKWVIFVTNKKDGEEFKNQLGDCSVFVTVDSKDSQKRDGKIYNEIITDAKFSCKVLICTSIMDNGINFKDMEIRNIVLLATDQTEFKQMLGRKRIINNEKVNLYICSRKSSYFNAKLLSLRKQIQAIQFYKRDTLTFSKKYCIGTASDVELFRGLFYFDKNLNVCINELAEIKIYNDKLFYESIISELSSGRKEAFIIKQLSWIDQEKTYSPCLWVSYDNSNENIAEFLKFLNENCNIPMSREAFDEFGKKFKMYFNNAYGIQDTDRNDRPSYKQTRMRKIFTELKLDYEIKARNYIYTLTKLS